jgi:hypothetical protein
MKRQILCLMSFFLILLFSNYNAANAKTPNMLEIKNYNTANAKTPNMLEIKNVAVDLENGKINIHGLKFGDNPIVVLDKIFLEIETSNDTYIQAWLPRDMIHEPKTFRLIVARDFDGFYYFSKYFNFNNKTDLLDITIGADEKSEPRVMESPMPLSPPDQLRSMKFYEKYKAVSLQPIKKGTITCLCDGRNDILWSGGYFINDINDSTLEYLIAVMESYPTYNNYIPHGWTVRVANYTKTDNVIVNVRILCLDTD